jgi:hypothetical protein
MLDHLKVNNRTWAKRMFSADDAQGGHFGETRYDLVGHAVGEEFLRGVAGEIRERQHGIGASSALR